MAAASRVDTVLVESGHDKNFLSFIAEGVNFVFGEGSSNKTTEMINKTVINASSPEIVDKITRALNAYKDFSDSPSPKN